jgi:hypothetical protein
MPAILETTGNDTQLREEYMRISRSATALSRLPQESNQSASGLYAQPPRTPWKMYTVANPADYIAWHCAPSQITWTLNQRSTLTKTLIGTVLDVWPDPSRGTLYDEAKVGFDIQVGNIMPQLPEPGTQPPYPSSNGGQSRLGEWRTAPGLKNFYSLLRLIDAPKITRDGRPNYVKIEYHSPTFDTLTLIGMFDPNGISFTESSADPSTITGIRVDFIVMDSIPRLSSSMVGQLASDITLQNTELENNYKGRLRRMPSP